MWFSNKHAEGMKETSKSMSERLKRMQKCAEKIKKEQTDKLSNALCEEDLTNPVVKKKRSVNAGEANDNGVVFEQRRLMEWNLGEA